MKCDSASTRNRAEGAIFASQRRHQHAPKTFYNFIRNTDEIQFRRGVAHRTRVGDHPPGDSVANVDSSSVEKLNFFTDHVRGDGFAGWLVDQVDHARIERHDRSQLVRDQRHRVVQVK